MNNNIPIIDLRKVVKSYETEAGPFLALKDIKLNIEKGEFVGVIGKSGSGKSTLINMISGIDKPTSGQIMVNSTEIQSLDENEMSLWRGKNLGIVFQFFQLLPTLSVIENVMLPMDFANLYSYSERKDKALELLDLVGVAEHADKLPSMTSGGQQQRVAIARALANDPPIVVADEPTGNLDSASAEKVFNLFEKLIKRGKTILMVTHDRDQAKRVNRTLIISDGEIIEEHLTQTFPGLANKDLIWLTSKLKVERYEPGEIIIKKGRAIDKLYIVSKGAVEIVIHTPNNKQYVVATYEKGQYFGEVELIHKGPSIASVRASMNGETEITAIDEQIFNQLLGRSKELKKSVYKEAMKRLQENLAKTKKSSRKE